MCTISEENLVYKAFDVAVNIFKLLTSYYYGYLAANRFHLVQVREKDPEYARSEFNTVIGCECVFLVHMITQALLEYKVQGGKLPVRDPGKTATRYLQTDFIYDLIPLIPFQFQSMYRNRQYLFYVVKMMRLWKGFDLFNVPKMMDKIKNHYQKSL